MSLNGLELRALVSKFGQTAELKALNEKKYFFILDLISDLRSLDHKASTY